MAYFCIMYSNIFLVGMKNDIVLLYVSIHTNYVLR